MRNTTRHGNRAKFGPVLACICIALSSGAPAASEKRAQETVPPSAGSTFSYADYADLTLQAPVVVIAQIAKAERLKGELAPGLAIDKARFLIQANVQTLLKGSDGLPGVISYIVDVSLGPKGKSPSLKNRRVLLLARQVPGRPLEVQLSSPYSQLDWTQAAEDRTRSILREATSASAPPRVTGVGNAFYVPGAIPGESEAQIFLTTADSRPISLSILRRPGEQPQWAVALGEMVDDSATAPPRDTLLWYNLACFLPARLPNKSVAALSPADGEAVRRDYKFVLDRLGTCERTIQRP